MLDFSEARKAHFDWKLTLSDYIANPHGMPKADVVGMDNQCELGRWLYGEGRKWSHLHGYKVLIALHAEFHKAAAAVVTKIVSGAPVTEEIMIGSKSRYGRASTELILAISEMAMRVEDAK